ncbi:MAG: hypothetical protein HC929_08870 [Leptolyngbyaceae cyanobacterium SM2_5_2]|nr:hypothetical protein [Leptolyngbyaceae cyanobacterium SM2_5_2]
MMNSATNATNQLAWLPQRQRHPKVLRFLGWALLGSAGLGLMMEYPALGQSINNATVTEILDSNQVYIQNQRTQVNGVAQRQQRVRTEAARTALRFNSGGGGCGSPIIPVWWWGNAPSSIAARYW